MKPASPVVGPGYVPVDDGVPKFNAKSMYKLVIVGFFYFSVDWSLMLRSDQDLISLS